MIGGTGEVGLGGFNPSHPPYHIFFQHKAVLKVEQSLKAEHAAALATANESAEAKLQAAVSAARSEAEAQRKEALLQQAKYMDELNTEKVIVCGVGYRGQKRFLVAKVGGCFKANT